jgi:hypothetical protein
MKNDPGQDKPKNEEKYFFPKILLKSFFLDKSILTLKCPLLYSICLVLGFGVKQERHFSRFLF